MCVCGLPNGLFVCVVSTDSKMLSSAAASGRLLSSCRLGAIPRVLMRPIVWPVTIRSRAGSLLDPLDSCSLSLRALSIHCTVPVRLLYMSISKKNETLLVE